MGEYGKYNVGELLEMTGTDDEESMRSIATGWVNTGSVLNTAKEALKERLEQMRGVWTAPSFGVFEEFINTTIAQVDAAQTQADNRGEAAGTIATTAGWARERVNEQYQQYLAASLTEATDGEAAEIKPGTEEFRAPYDKQAREIMNVALEEYQQNKPAMTQDVVQFKPVKVNQEWSDGQDSWPGDGGSGSNASDTAGLSATSYGSNAVGAQGPTLQTGGHAPVSVTGGPNTGLPATTNSGPVFNGPPVGGMPPGTVNKSSIAPPKLPAPGGNGARNYLAPRTSGTASKTPGLPNSRSNMSRVGPGQTGRANGIRADATPARTGKGLQKSQMPPKDLTKRVRSSGEVIGGRPANSKSSSANTKSNQVSRRIQSPVVRGAKAGKGKSRMDNTKRGYTSRVINARDRLAESKGHSRTPYVGDKMKHTTKPEPIGKRQEPETARTRARRDIDAIRKKRRQKLVQNDGLSRPVIDNGLTNTVDIHQAVPTQRDAVKAEESFWQPQTGMVEAVLGKRRWDPDAVEHNPGPVFNPRQDFIDGLDARVSNSHHAGPKAFDSQRRPVDPWPNQ